MTRRTFASLAAVGAGTPPPAPTAQPGPAPLRYRDYSRCLPDFLRTLARQAYQARNREIAALTTAEAVRRRQRWVAETFWKLVGGMPERRPLNAKVTGSFERPGYRLEKVVYESQPKLYVSGNLYIPTAGHPPYPGVLFQMGHTSNGKAGDLYQKCCQGLARLGFVVLGFDPMGQGERTNYPGPTPSRSRLRGGADDEHTIPGKQMLLIGDSSVRLQTWDAVRSLDYLAAHPLVDPKRLASTGQSGGGTNTMLLAAVDDRLAAAAVSCGNTENLASADFNPPGATDDAEQDFPGSGPLGFDRWDLLYPLAPKPLLVMPSARDFAGTYSPNYIASGVEEFGKLRAVYEMMGHPDRLAWQDTLLPHGLAYGFRLAIYNWFLRWLMGAPPITVEPPVTQEPEETLFVSPGGSVVEAYGGQTPFRMARDQKIVKQPVPLGSLLGVDRPRAAPQAATLARTEFRQAHIEALEVASAPGVWLPAYLYRPKAGGSGKPLLLLLDPAGRGQWPEGSLYDTLAAQGYPVCALDVRGIGELSPEYSRGSARHGGAHRSEQHYAWSSMILGKPLLGQRVTDIVATVRALGLRKDLVSGGLVLAARGILTIPALFAAALEPAIGAVYLAGGLVSYRNIMETEEYLGGSYHNAGNNENDLFGAFVPGLLKHTDLPEAAAAIAPRRVTLAGAVDAAGKKMDAGEVARVYAAAGSVRVLSEGAWSAAALARAAGAGA